MQSTVNDFLFESKQLTCNTYFTQQISISSDISSSKKKKIFIADPCTFISYYLCNKYRLFQALIILLYNIVNNLMKLHHSRSTFKNWLKIFFPLKKETSKHLITSQICFAKFFLVPKQRFLPRWIHAPPRVLITSRSLIKLRYINYLETALIRGIETDNLH